MLLRTFVDVAAPRSVDAILAEAFLARAHRAAVCRNADLLAAAVTFPTGIVRSTRSVPRLVTCLALATIRSVSIDAFERTKAIGRAGYTFVYIDAGSLILRQLVADRARTKVTADRVGAYVRALAISLAALVDIQARGLVRMQIVAFVARAYVAA